MIRSASLLLFGCLSLVAAPARALAAVADSASRGEIVASVTSEVRRACRRIAPGALVRVSGPFGRLEEHLEAARPEGLVRLTARDTSRLASTPPLPEILAWSDITQVEVRGSSALKGGMLGGAVLGGLGALIGAAAVSALGDGHVSAGTGAFQGAVYLAPVGFLTGALAGSAMRRWDVVYVRR